MTYRSFRGDSINKRKKLFKNIKDKLVREKSLDIKKINKRKSK